MSDVDIRLLDRAGDQIAALPGARLTAAGWVLSETETLSFDIHPLAKGADKIIPWDTEVRCIWNGGDVVVEGPVTGLSGDPTNLSVSCEGVLSWTKKRIVDRMSLIYGDPGDPGDAGNPNANPPIPPTPPVAPVLIEQFTIAWNLISYAQDESVQANRDFRLDAGAYGPSGIGRSANYKRSEHGIIYDLLQDFRTMYQGFEFGVEYDGHSRLWTPYYPQKGVQRPEFTMVFDQTGARNLSTFTYTEDGLGMSTQDYATGGTVEGQKLENNYEDVEASSRHGVLQTVTSQGSSVDIAWLGGKAHAKVDRLKEPIKSFQINSVTTKDLSMFGILKVGDSVPLRINFGRIQANEMRRVQQIDWAPNDQLTITFVQVDDS